MINNLNQSQSTMISHGYKAGKRKYDLKQILFFALIFLYFFFGKWKVFTIFRVSTDYLFWVFIAGLLITFLVFEHKIQVTTGLIPIVVYLSYQAIEMQRSAYRSTALPAFLFNILTLWVFLFVKDRKGYEKTFIKCLYYGGLYYTVTVLLQAAFPDLMNRLRELLLTSVEDRKSVV